MSQPIRFIKFGWKLRVSWREPAPIMGWLFFRCSSYTCSVEAETEEQAKTEILNQCPHEYGWSKPKVRVLLKWVTKEPRGSTVEKIRDKTGWYKIVTVDSTKMPPPPNLIVAKLLGIGIPQTAMSYEGYHTKVWLAHTETADLEGQLQQPSWPTLKVVPD